MEIHAVGGTSAQGSRPGQEDQYAILTPGESPSGIQNTLALFAVFDGHGSDAVAKHAREYVPQLVFESLDAKKGNYETAMQAAIDQEDTLLLREFSDGEDQFATAGSTVSLALVDLKEGVLVVGNLGDSHILLAEKDAQSGQLKEVSRLTQSHKPENTEEKQRIEEAGGEVHWQKNIPRIGNLNMSRALGDLQYKNPLNNITTAPSADGQETAARRRSEEKDDYLTVQMSFTQVDLKKDGKYILALTTDGITNVMNDDMVMQKMVKGLNSGTNATEVAQSLVDEVAVMPGSDNATCIIVFLNGVSSPAL
ncbi:phosphatase 2C-like domain-containing protein [Aspergillus aurantiobrunneus]